jgi:hypothetical protein
LNETLSVIVPVFNAQNSLAREVHELLEVLSDLSSRFELLVVDDGSTDQTSEVACELARQFPQIRILRHPRRTGASASAQSGLRQATGDFVFVQDEFSPLNCMELRRLWEQRMDDRQPTARVASPGGLDSGLLKRLSDWGVTLRRDGQGKGAPSGPQRCGIQMIRRHALRPMHGRDAQPVS